MGAGAGAEVVDVGAEVGAVDVGSVDVEAVGVVVVGLRVGAEVGDVGAGAGAEVVAEAIGTGTAGPFGVVNFVLTRPQDAA